MSVEWSDVELTDKAREKGYRESQPLFKADKLVNRVVRQAGDVYHDRETEAYHLVTEHYREGPISIVVRPEDEVLVVVTQMHVKMNLENNERFEPVPEGLPEPGSVDAAADGGREGAA